MEPVNKVASSQRASVSTIVVSVSKNDGSTVSFSIQSPDASNSPTPQSAIGHRQVSDASSKASSTANSLANLSVTFKPLGAATAIVARLEYWQAGRDLLCTPAKYVSSIRESVDAFLVEAKLSATTVNTDEAEKWRDIVRRARICIEKIGTSFSTFDNELQPLVYQAVLRLFSFVSYIIQYTQTARRSSSRMLSTIATIDSCVTMDCIYAGIDLKQTLKDTPGPPTVVASSTEAHPSTPASTSRVGVNFDDPRFTGLLSKTVDSSAPGDQRATSSTPNRQDAATVSSRSPIQSAPCQVCLSGKLDFNEPDSSSLLPNSPTFDCLRVLSDIVTALDRVRHHPTPSGEHIQAVQKIIDASLKHAKTTAVGDVSPMCEADVQRLRDMGKQLPDVLRWLCDWRLSCDTEIKSSIRSTASKLLELFVQILRVSDISTSLFDNTLSYSLSTLSSKDTPPSSSTSTSDNFYIADQLKNQSTPLPAPSSSNDDPGHHHPNNCIGGPFTRVIIEKSEPRPNEDMARIIWADNFSNLRYGDDYVMTSGNKQNLMNQTYEGTWTIYPSALLLSVKAVRVGNIVYVRFASPFYIGGTSTLKPDSAFLEIMNPGAENDGVFIHHPGLVKAGFSRSVWDSAACGWKWSNTTKQFKLANDIGSEMSPDQYRTGSATYFTYFV